MNENPQATFEQLGEYVEAQLKAKGVPGAAVGLLYGGETYSAGFGVTSVENPLPVTPETLFQIGSISKTFTCLALMRLVEQNKVDLEATVRTYLPEFKVADEAASAHAKVWHLLTHVAGWVGDLFDDTGCEADALANYVAKMADLEQLAPLGQVWSYNNASFGLAGYLIEQVTGQLYETAIQELVFEPLGLKRCFLDAGNVISFRFAVGHAVEDGTAKVLRPWPLPRYARSMGGIVTDVGDLLRYAQFQMGDGKAAAGEDAADGDVGGEEAEPVQIVQPDTLVQMHAPKLNRWGEKEQMGLAWFINDVGGTRQLSHGGGTLGQISLLCFFPEHKTALAVLTNATEGGAITDGVRRWVLEHYLGIEDKKPEPVEATEDELAEYVGFYSRPMSDFELGLLNGRLVGQMVIKQGFPSKEMPPPPPPPPSALAPCGKDRLLIVAGPNKGGTVDVIRKEDGSIGWLRAGRIHRKVR